jgi:hypothetical protein
VLDFKNIEEARPCGENLAEAVGAMLVDQLNLAQKLITVDIIIVTVLVIMNK